MEPLLVFYMDGWVRVFDYRDEAKRGRSIERMYVEAPFDELEQILQQRYHGNSIQDPLLHVKNQMKQILGQVAHEFRNVTMQDSYNSTKALDGFDLFGADFVIDENFQVHLTNLQHHVKLGEDYYFRLQLNHELFYGMASILQELWGKQEVGLPLLPIENAGQWELVYADGWKFEYDEFVPEMPKATC